ncbi:diguanylate cyclase [Ideonella sp.]|uniref:diguanylate cyclase n=1 Tax=Ideonella sp. TaxID=1929293 RepID=UPI0035B23FD5
MAAPAAVDGTASTVVQALREHGYASPADALQRLRSAAAPADAEGTAWDRVGWRAASLMADMAWRVNDPAVHAGAMQRLRHLADDPACAPCRAALLLRQVQQDESVENAPWADLLARLSALPEPADAALRVEWRLARAMAHSMLGDYDSAIADAVHATEVAASHHLPADRVEALSALAVVSANRRDLPRAVGYVREGIALAREIGFEHALVRLLVDLSYSLAAQKESRERRQVLEEVLRLAERRPGQEQVQMNALINLAALGNDTGQYARAAEFARRAERLADREVDPNGHAFALVNRGVAWVHLGRHDEGLALVRTAVEIAERTGNQRELADLVEQQVAALEAAGRPQEALQALRRWVKLDQALTTTQREQAVARLQEQFAAQQRAREIEHLKSDKARQDAELQLRTWREIAWALAALAVAWLAFATWKRLSRSRQDVARLSAESLHDPLTGACNRRFGEGLLQRLEQDNAALPPARRRAVSLLLLDVDHFKRVNDTHGHAAGDAVLVEMTRRLAEVLRDGDAIVRWGGEEFLLVLPGTDATGLRAVAERVLAALGSAPMDLPGGTPLPVRASAGGVSFRAGRGQPWAAWLAQADAALYLAKAQGRNQVVLALGEAPLPEADLARLPACAAAGGVDLRAVPGVPDASN